MALTTEDKYQYWLSYARNDIETAEVMLNSGRWYYTVFMCQQAVEKLIKGLYVLYVDDNVPRLHDINSIFDRYRERLPEPLTEDRVELFDTLSQFYLRSRYPDYTSVLASITTGEMAQTIYEKSMGAFQWLLTMKP
jgi:HEPN domain-containing protein